MKNRKRIGMTALKDRIIYICIIFILFSNGIGFCGVSDYWPEEHWRVSTPEEQGMQSDPLAEMVETILLNPNSIDSVTVIRNGYMVLDVYFYPFQKDTAHIIHSCIKSIMSTLIGIAIDKGYIKDVNLGLLDSFPEISPAKMTPLKQKITLENMLTMSSGLDSRDSYKHRWTGLTKMRKSRDWTKYMLDLPIKETPGTVFEYSNGTSYLLSAILQKNTGVRSLDFAKEHLFTPLGIQEVKWEANSQGIDVGYGRMWLKPHDMAKFGWLFLKQGYWKNKRIVSEKWVTSATKGRLNATLYDRYGYQWWVDNQGWYSAVGYGGQRIFVVPQHDLVVVFTSNKGSGKPDRFMREYVLESVVSDQPVVSAPQSETRLKELIGKSMTPPEPSPLIKLPPLVETLSGKKYTIESNEAGFNDFTIIFEKDKPEARLICGIRQERYNVIIGLDGLYRTTNRNGENLAFKGKWVNNDSFTFSMVNVGHTEQINSLVKFVDNHVLMNIFGYWGTTLNLKGSRQ